MKISILLVALTLSLTSEAATRRAWAAVGDSITNGHAFDADTYPERLEVLLGAPVDNFGIGFDTALRAYTRWQTYVEPFQYAGTIIFIGTNDLRNGTSAATLWTTVEPWAEEVLAAGQHLVFVKVSPRWGSSGWTGDMETERLTYNTQIDGFATANPSVIVVESDTLLGTGSPVALRAEFDFGDDLHLNGAGFAALATNIAGLIQ